MVNGVDALFFHPTFGWKEWERNTGGSAKGRQFPDIFRIYDLAEKTEIQDKGSVLSLLTGDVDDISSVMIDSEKAKIALSLTIEIRNKILEAYNELMNMQV
jgi:flagellar hook-basal body complex protein FliE